MRNNHFAFILYTSNYFNNIREDGDTLSSLGHSLTQDRTLIVAFFIYKNISKFFKKGYINIVEAISLSHTLQVMYWNKFAPETHTHTHDCHSCHHYHVHFFTMRCRVRNSNVSNRNPCSCVFFSYYISIFSLSL